MFQAAVLAVIVSHPRPDLLRPALNDHLARVDAGIVAESSSEEHLQGAQAAQKLLMLALSESEARAGIGLQN
jgi:hypothetical protein